MKTDACPAAKCPQNNADFDQEFFLKIIGLKNTLDANNTSHTDLILKLSENSKLIKCYPLIVRVFKNLSEDELYSIFDEINSKDYKSVLKCYQTLLLLSKKSGNQDILKILLKMALKILKINECIIFFSHVWSIFLNSEVESIVVTASLELLKLSSINDLQKSQISSSLAKFSSFLDHEIEFLNAQLINNFKISNTKACIIFLEILINPSHNNFIDSSHNSFIINKMQSNAFNLESLKVACWILLSQPGFIPPKDTSVLFNKQKIIFQSFLNLQKINEKSIKQQDKSIINEIILEKLEFFALTQRFSNNSSEFVKYKDLFWSYISYILQTNEWIKKKTIKKIFEGNDLVFKETLKTINIILKSYFLTGTQHFVKEKGISKQIIVKNLSKNLKEIFKCFSVMPQSVKFSQLELILKILYSPVISAEENLVLIKNLLKILKIKINQLLWSDISLILEVLSDENCSKSFKYFIILAVMSNKNLHLKYLKSLNELMFQPSSEMNMYSILTIFFGKSPFFFLMQYDQYSPLTKLIENKNSKFNEKATITYFNLLKVNFTEEKNYFEIAPLSEYLYDINNRIIDEKNYLNYYNVILNCIKSREIRSINPILEFISFFYKKKIIDYKSFGLIVDFIINQIDAMEYKLDIQFLMEKISAISFIAFREEFLRLFTRLKSYLMIQENSKKHQVNCTYFCNYLCFLIAQIDISSEILNKLLEIYQSLTSKFSMIQIKDSSKLAIESLRYDEVDEISNLAKKCTIEPFIEIDIYINFLFHENHILTTQASKMLSSHLLKTYDKFEDIIIIIDRIYSDISKSKLQNELKFMCLITLLNDMLSYVEAQFQLELFGNYLMDKVLKDNFIGIVDYNQPILHTLLVNFALKCSKYDSLKSEYWMKFHSFIDIKSYSKSAMKILILSPFSILSKLYNQEKSLNTLLKVVLNSKNDKLVESGFSSFHDLLNFTSKNDPSIKKFCYNLTNELMNSLKSEKNPNSLNSIAAAYSASTSIIIKDFPNLMECKELLNVHNLLKQDDFLQKYAAIEVMRYNTKILGTKMKPFILKTIDEIIILADSSDRNCQKAADDYLETVIKNADCRFVKNISKMVYSELNRATIDTPTIKICGYLRLLGHIIRNALNYVVDDMVTIIDTIYKIEKMCKKSQISSAIQNMFVSFTKISLTDKNDDKIKNLVQLVSKASEDPSSYLFSCLQTLNDSSLIRNITNKSLILVLPPILNSLRLNFDKKSLMETSCLLIQDIYKHNNFNTLKPFNQLFINSLLKKITKYTEDICDTLKVILKINHLSQSADCISFFIDSIFTCFTKELFSSDSLCKIGGLFELIWSFNYHIQIKGSINSILEMHKNKNIDEKVVIMFLINFLTMVYQTKEAKIAFKIDGIKELLNSFVQMFLDQNENFADHQLLKEFMESFCSCFPNFYYTLVIEEFSSLFCSINMLKRKNFFIALRIIVQSACFGTNMPQNYNELSEVYERMYYVINDRKKVENIMTFLFIGTCDSEHIISNICIQNWQSLVLKQSLMLKSIPDNLFRCIYMMILISKEEIVRSANQVLAKYVGFSSTLGNLNFIIESLSSKVHDTTIDQQQISELFVTVLQNLKKNVVINNSQNLLLAFLKICRFKDDNSRNALKRLVETLGNKRLADYFLKCLEEPERMFEDFNFSVENLIEIIFTFSISIVHSEPDKFWDLIISRYLGGLLGRGHFVESLTDKTEELIIDMISQSSHKILISPDYTKENKIIYCNFLNQYFSKSLHQFYLHIRKLFVSIFECISLFSDSMLNFNLLKLVKKIFKLSCDINFQDEDKDFSKHGDFEGTISVDNLFWNFRDNLLTIISAANYSHSHQSNNRKDLSLKTCENFSLIVEIFTITIRNCEYSIISYVCNFLREVFNIFKPDTITRKSCTKFMACALDILSVPDNNINTENKDAILLSLACFYVYLKENTVKTFNNKYWPDVIAQICVEILKISNTNYHEFGILIFQEIISKVYGTNSLLELISKIENYPEIKPNVYALSNTLNFCASYYLNNFKAPTKENFSHLKFIEKCGFPQSLVEEFKSKLEVLELLSKSSSLEGVQKQLSDENSVDWF